MKENEFKEKVPMIDALNESTILFNKDKYKKAIEILVAVLKTDTSTDVSTTIRGDVWFNLSVNYILTDQISKAVEAIFKYMPFTDIESSNQIFIEESLTESQKEMLKTNYRFKNYSYFLESPKYRKKFELLIKKYENGLKEIEKLVQRGGYVKAIDYLKPFQETIVYLFFDLKVNALFDLKELKVSNKLLLDLLQELDKLFSICKTKANEIIRNDLENRHIKIENQIKKDQYSLAKEQLNEIISYFNDFGDDYRMEFNDIYKKTSSLLDTCEGKEEKIRENLITLEKNVYENLIEVRTMIDKDEFNKAKNQLENIIKNAEENKLKEIKIKANSLLKELKRSKKNGDELFEFESMFKQLQEQTEKLNFVDALIHKKSINSIVSLSEFFRKRENLLEELRSTYQKFKKNERIRSRIKSLFIKFYTLHFEINPFEADENLLHHLKGSLETEITRLKGTFDNIAREDGEFNKFKNELETINYNELKHAFIERLGKKVKEFTYDVPVSNLYEFLLDFSEVLPLGVGTGGKTEDSTETDYTIKTHFGLLIFKIIEKEENKKIIYEYDFSKSDVKEIGKLYLDFITLSPGKVKLRVKNEIHESSGGKFYLNWLGHLKPWIDYNLGKLVAKHVQTVFYEKTFDDLTMGNYRVLQTKINAMGKKFEDLKSRFFEVKAPLTLNSFECSECGATLNITSKDEKFIICDHCSTPFLMEWQKE